jgi:hypothetical protein
VQQNVDTLTISSHVRQNGMNLKLHVIFYLEIWAGRNSNRHRKNADTLWISLHVRQNSNQPKRMLT